MHEWLPALWSTYSDHDFCSRLFLSPPILVSNLGESQDRGTIMTFGCGCVLTFAGVKLLTGSKQKPRTNSLSGLVGSPAAAPLMDEKERAIANDTGPVPMPVTVRPHRGHVRSVSHGGGGSGLPLYDEDGSLQQLTGIHPFDEEYEQLQPLALLNSPLGVSGDVLRRTFSSRLTTFAERARQLGNRPRTNSF